MAIDEIVKEILADKVGRQDSYNFDRLYKEIIGEAANYCFIPGRYVRDNFAMESPTQSQQQAIEILNLMLGEQNPLRPALSLYLHGPVGTGKTHIIAAYATQLAKLLQCEVKKREDKAKGYFFSSVRHMRISIDDYNRSLQNAQWAADEYDPVKDCALDYSSLRTTISWSDNPKGGMSMSEMQTFLDPQKIAKAKEMKKQEIMEDAMKSGRERVDENIRIEMNYLKGLKSTLDKEVPYCETDIVFVEFEKLLPMIGSKPELLEELIKAPVLIIDDIHPKGEEERAKAIQFIFEQRYNRATGGTFVTSNLSPSELLKVGKYDPKISQRLESRCAEMFIVIDTGDASDYRQVIMKQKADEVRKKLAAARQGGKKE